MNFMPDSVSSPEHSFTDGFSAALKSLPMVLHTRVVTGSGGGPEKTILNSPRFLPSLGYQSICVYMRETTNHDFEKLRKRATEWNARLIEVDDGGPFDTSVYRRMLAICREQKVAIWHGHDYKSNLIGLWVRRYWPMKLVTTVHGWGVTGGRTALYYAIDRLCMRWYDKVICVSDDLHDRCVRSGISSDRCLIIQNAIDTQQFSRSMDVRAAKQKLGFDPNRYLIGAVGRLSEEKRFDLLIRAVGELRRAGRDVSLAIVGEGDQRSVLERVIAELGLQDHVRLLGFRSDTIDLYQAFDLYALSSVREGLPNVVLEAMAMGVPVVATSIAGVPKLVTDGVDGLLVPAGDVSSLHQAIDRLYQDREFASRLSAAARTTIEQRFSFTRRMEKVARVYDSVMK